MATNNSTVYVCIVSIGRNSGIAELRSGWMQAGDWLRLDLVFRFSLSRTSCLATAEAAAAAALPLSLFFHFISF